MRIFLNVFPMKNISNMSSRFPTKMKTRQAFFKFYFIMKAPQFIFHRKMMGDSI